MEPPAQPPLLVFADDWGRHPSSCQHLIRHLLPRRQVVWVNTIGTRPPRLDWTTAKRVAGKLREWVSVGQAVPDAGAGERQAQPDLPKPAAPRIVSPKMWPSFKSSAARRLNRTLLLRALNPVVASLPQPPIVVTTLPLVADLIGRLPAARWVYYCVDDFSVWPGYDGETMLRMERGLVPKVNEVVAVSETLVKHVAALGKPAHLLTHGVELDYWKPSELTTAPEFARLEPPVVLFWGVIDRRMDLAFVRATATALDRGTLVFVGPQDVPDPELFRLPRVVVHPAVSYDRLPPLAAAATVLVMPYTDAPVTRAMQPLKLKEYLATGKPAVVRDLPATRLWADACDVADTPHRFAAFVKARLQTGLPTDQAIARGRLADESWAAKAMQFEEWVNGRDFPLPAANMC
jgi:glycosyltransferase involved in cell wall biosynthesis